MAEIFKLLSIIDIAEEIKEKLRWPRHLLLLKPRFGVDGCGIQHLVISLPSDRDQDSTTPCPKSIATEILNRLEYEAVNHGINQVIFDGSMTPQSLDSLMIYSIVLDVLG